MAVRTADEVIAWFEERRENCHRLAAFKSGRERAGWLEDADYFAQALLLMRAAMSDSQEPT